MREVLQVHLADVQYDEMLKRYHFSDHDLNTLKQIVALTEQTVDSVLYYDSFPEQDRLAVIVTLGDKIDELQNCFIKEDRLTEAYMTECAGMELLKTAYEQVAERIHAHTGRWMSDFAFVGDSVPFAEMDRIFQKLAPKEVTYNNAYVLTPKKTVVFLADLCEERRDSYCHVCDDCGYLVCPHRSQAALPRENLTYGYQRIFGRELRTADAGDGRISGIRGAGGSS